MFKQSKENAKLPQTLYEATIALILKKDRDSMEMSSYRPVSFLPIENKVLTKILANRLKTYISDIIHPDQTGFIPGRHIYYNLRRLFNVMYHDHKFEAVVIALDAEKAFDRIEWKYMMSVLEHFRFRKEFINRIRIIYAHPMASVVTNQEMSQSFRLFKGCRQGCPISPALFTIAMEPLATRIRACADIASVKIKDTQHKISLYADDVLLFLSKPKTFIPPLLNLINTFGSFSGYKINWQKSELMPISRPVDMQFLQSTPFRTVMDKFTSLGIVVTRDLDQLLKANWDMKIYQLKQNIDFWKTLPISLVGRINTIKMVVLPRFLYLFQCLPNFIPQSYFKKLDSIVTLVIFMG